MTQENCIRLLAYYEAAIKNNELTEQARLNAKVAFADMQKHIAKYRPELIKPKPVPKK